MAEYELRRTWLRKSLLVAGGATTLMTAPGLVGQEKEKGEEGRQQR